MTYINWNKPFEFELGNESLYAPTYGNYGGDDYSSGRFGKDAPLDQDGSYLSNRELDDNKDALDYLFYRHDVASTLAENSAEQKTADLTLIRGIGDLSDRQLDDPEASLYAGLATVALSGQLLLNHPKPALAERLVPYLEDALDNIETGLWDLSLEEFAEATALLTETVEVLQGVNFVGRAVDAIVDDLGWFV